MAGRTGVRATIYSFLSVPQITNLNQIFTSFPKRIDFNVNSTPGSSTRAAAVIFIASETESRIAIGGATNGIKRVDYTIILQIYQHSFERNAEAAMTSFDTLIDAIKTRLRSDHRFGDTNGTLVWQGAEPRITTRYGEPSTAEEGMTETYAEVEFEVTEMIHA
jgi:hypothetical protein